MVKHRPKNKHKPKTNKKKRKPTETHLRSSHTKSIHRGFFGTFMLGFFGVPGFFGFFGVPGFCLAGDFDLLKTQ